MHFILESAEQLFLKNLPPKSAAFKNLSLSLPPEIEGRLLQLGYKSKANIDRQRIAGMLAVIRHQEFGDADQQDVARLPVSEGDCRNR